jgi:glycosyltransferase involved in cell wall biosynthesis
LSSKLDRRVLVVLGLYRPDLQLLSRQLASLFAQTHQNIEVFISADGPQGSDVRDAIGRFAGRPIHLLEHDTRVGVHANFGRGLRAALDTSRTDTDLFAFCDQDDFWHPEKLARQVEVLAVPEASLCHCDARIVSRDGNLLRPSLFEHEHRSRTASFADLLAMNSVTGMTAVFRSDVAEAAATFPMSRCRYILHDHWTALVASLLGRVHFINAPLVDYTQHAGNVMGARDWAGSMPRALSSSLRRAYLRKCYRQFLWRRRALDELRRSVGDHSAARKGLFAAPVRALFDCQAGRASGLSLSLAHRLRGEWRQADQIWRIWRGKTLYCASAEVRSRRRLQHQDGI